MAALDEEFLRGLLPKGSLAIPLAGRFTPLGRPKAFRGSRTLATFSRTAPYGQVVRSPTRRPSSQGQVLPVKAQNTRDLWSRRPFELRSPAKGGSPVGREGGAGGAEPQAAAAPFVKPTTQEGWQEFHKQNEAGMSKAYASPDGLWKEGGRLYIAGTRGVSDVLDWPKIALGTFKDSEIYRRAEPAFKDDPDIKMVIGHSAGGSAALELEKRFPDRKVTSVTYNAPVFSPLDPGQLAEKDQPLRFKTLGDPVAIFDENARVTVKAPAFPVEAAKNLAKAFVDPSPINLVKAAREKPDPLLGLHGMTGTYSKPSGPEDFLKSAAGGLALGAVAGVIGV